MVYWMYILYYSIVAIVRLPNHDIRKTAIMVTASESNYAKERMTLKANESNHANMNNLRGFIT